MRHPARALRALVWVLGLSSGCATGGLPEIHYYTLAAPAPGAQRPAGAGTDAGLAIGVESLAVDPPYDQDRIVYRRSPEATEVGFYNYHRWASPVGRLVQSALVEGMRGAPRVGSIEPAVSTGEYDARLGGRVLYLEHIDGPEAQAVRVAVQLQLRDEEETLWSTTVEVTSAGDIFDVPGAAALFARAVDELLERARGELASALSAPRPGAR